MEFWGAEVKSGEPLMVVPGEGMVLHLSQACLGELKKEKGNESVCLFVKVDGKKLVLGTLFSKKFPQQQFDLGFDRDFELSHNWKSGSVYFYGNKASRPLEEDESEDGESDEAESEPEPDEDSMEFDEYDDDKKAMPVPFDRSQSLRAPVKKEKLHMEGPNSEVRLWPPPP